MRSHQEKPILSLRSCCLYHADVALFTDNAWLNDACIAFYFEVLQAKADVVFGRVVEVAQESDEHSKHCTSASAHKNGTQEEENETDLRGEFELKHRCSKLPGEKDRATSNSSASSVQSSGGGQVGGQSPATSSSGERQTEGKQSLFKGENGSRSFTSKIKVHRSGGERTPGEEVSCFSNSRGRTVQPADKGWLPILSSLIIVKSPQQPGPSEAAGVDMGYVGEDNGKAQSCRYTPRFQTFEDRYTPVLFVDPCVAFWLAFSDDEDEVRVVLRDLTLEKRLVVLWPISDKQNLSTPGGTHWTLLVQVVQEREFFLTRGSVEARDARGANAELCSAQKVNLGSTHLRKEYKFFHLNSLSSRSSFASVAAAERLQGQILAHIQQPPHSKTHTRNMLESVKCTYPQTNSSDCGVYCLMYAEKILTAVTEWWAYNASSTSECWGKVNKPELNVSVTDVVRRKSSPQFVLNFQEIQRVAPAEALAKRKAIASLIRGLSNG